MRHIAGSRITWPSLDLTDHPELQAFLPPGAQVQLDSGIQAFVEEQLLRAGRDTYRGIGFDHSDSDHGERFVEFENKLAALIKQHRLKGDAIDVAVRGADFGDISPAVVAGLERIGMTYEQFMESLGGERGLVAFMDDLPTRYVTNVLRSAKQRQGQQLWEPNDFIDIVALPVPAVYCDVVVTEKQWVHHMRRGADPLPLLHDAAFECRRAGRDHRVGISRLKPLVHEAVVTRQDVRPAGMLLLDTRERAIHIAYAFMSAHRPSLST